MTNQTIVLNRPVILLGGGGHARVLLDLLHERGASVLGVVTKDGKGAEPFPGIRILGDDDAVLRYAVDQVALVNAVGYSSDRTLRKRVHEFFARRGYRFPALVHPAATVSTFARLNDGCQIMAGAVVQAGADVGCGAIVNTLASVDHDCTIGPYAHVAPGAHLSGNVQVGECSLIGVGSSVRQGIRIGAMCIVGAGSAVIRDIPDNGDVGSAPARPLKLRRQE